MASYTVTSKDREEKKKKTDSSNSSSSSVSSSLKTTPQYEANPDFAKDFDYDARINAAISSGADQATIDSLKAQKAYAEGVRNGTVKQGGYGPGQGYNNRETRFTFKLDDGTLKDFSSNATTYQDAAKLAGIDLNTAELLRAATYGTKSSAYSPKGYGFGTIGGAEDFTTDLYLSEDPSRFYDMQNMQLAFLEGRDGFHYSAPLVNYNPSGTSNAYNKGKEFEGLGSVMGAYNVNQEFANGTTLNDLATAQMNMSSEDLMAILQLQKQYQDAMANGDVASANVAHEQAEAIRAMYGYSGGVDGSEYIPAELLGGYTANNGNLFGNISGSYGGYGGNYNGNEYDSRYDPVIQELLEQLLAQESFTYNPETDPLFQQIRASLLREGNRSMNDVLASAASQAGGMNSYAVTAAQQALNNANAEIGDIIPELWQLAYGVYADDYNRDLQNLGLLQNLDAYDYEQFLNDRNFNYNAYRDSVADSQYEKEFEYNSNLANKESAYNQAMDYLGMGIMPSASLLSQAGIGTAEAQAMIDSVLGKTNNTRSNSNPSPKPKDDPKPKEDNGYSSLPDYAKGLYTDIMKKGYSPTEIDEKLTAEVDNGYITLAQAKILADILIG